MADSTKLNESDIFVAMARRNLTGLPSNETIALEASRLRRLEKDIQQLKTYGLI